MEQPSKKPFTEMEKDLATLTFEAVRVAGELAEKYLRQPNVLKAYRQQHTTLMKNLLGMMADLEAKHYPDPVPEEPETGPEPE